jgi:hypothetical protein
MACRTNHSLDKREEGNEVASKNLDLFERIKLVKFEWRTQPSTIRVIR